MENCAYCGSIFVKRADVGRGYDKHRANSRLRYVGKQDVTVAEALLTLYQHQVQSPLILNPIGDMRTDCVKLAYWWDELPALTFA